MTMSKSLKRSFTVIIIAFILIIVSVVATFIIAQKNFEPVMREDYYKVGMDYQGILDNLAQARKLGLKVEVVTNKRLNLDMQTLTIKVKSTKKTKLEQIEALLFIEKRATVRGRKIHELTSETALKCDSAPCEYTLSKNFLLINPAIWGGRLVVKINNHYQVLKEIKFD